MVSSLHHAGSFYVWDHCFGATACMTLWLLYPLCVKVFFMWLIFTSRLSSWHMALAHWMKAAMMPYHEHRLGNSQLHILLCHQCMDMWSKFLNESSSLKKKQQQHLCWMCCFAFCVRKIDIFSYFPYLCPESWILWTCFIISIRVKFINAGVHCICKFIKCQTKIVFHIRAFSTIAWHILRL
jgi:hypothetical protein